MLRHGIWEYIIAMRDEDNYSANCGEIRRTISFQFQATAKVLFKRDALLVQLDGKHSDLVS
jgi:hypothetical protein